MGLGKTVQVLALLEAAGLAGAMRGNGNGESRHDLGAVAGRRAALARLQLEARRRRASRRSCACSITPALDRGKTRPATSSNYDLVLTTYGTLRRDVGVLEGRARSTTSILDEAQAIKNAASESAKAVRLLRRDHRLALSAARRSRIISASSGACSNSSTPACSARVACFKRPAAGARTPTTRRRELLSPRAAAVHPAPHQGAGRQGAAREARADDLLRARRRAAQALRRAARALPPVAARHASPREGIEQSEDPGARSAAAAAPGGVPSGPDRQEARRTSRAPSSTRCCRSSPKWSRRGTRRWSSRSSPASWRSCASGSTTTKIDYEYLDGKTRDRQARVERFQNDPNCKLFLISLKAGGVGLNLTAAEYVFLLDPWWNPAVEAQAIDRAHRIGQTRQVFAYRLIAQDTVEEKVLELQQTKRDLADAIINADNSLIRNLKRDLELLLS